MGLDLEQRYAAIDGSDTDHVCTGNAVYRAAALHAVGLFDEHLGYGYDNDMSYRLARQRLPLCCSVATPAAGITGAAGCCRISFSSTASATAGSIVVARHRSRFRGDAVSPADMMLHPLLMLAAACTAGRRRPGPDICSRHWLVAGLLVSGLVFERLIAGCRAAFDYRDAGGAGLSGPAHRSRCGLGGGHRRLVRAADRLDADAAGVQHASATFEFGSPIVSRIAERGSRIEDR